ncbi:endonuclease/exonuclease/phosphatase family protein [Ferrimonas pelagia]|uniref:Endonuclease/exonuclease/phosphatase family protein n=1 Tax=Ferrimonas pelagia TaxID=1177826 RepID=A0ABP9EV40_9GAMM
MLNVVRASRPFAIALLCTLTLSACPAPEEQAQIRQLGHYPATHLSGETLTLLNWNIYKQRQAPEWQQELSAIKRDYAPQILTFQEINVDLSQDPGFDGFGQQFAANLKLDESQASGVATASRSAPIASQAYLSDPKEPLLASPKLFLTTEFALSQRDDTLLLVNIHAINFVTTHNYQRQLLQLRQQVLSHSGPMILAGDFNSWNPTRRQQLDQIAEQLQLQAVQFSQPVSAFMGQPLDHIYHSPHLSVSQAHTLAQYQSSDHHPLLVEFAFLPNRP